MDKSQVGAVDTGHKSFAAPADKALKGDLFGINRWNRYRIFYFTGGWFRDRFQGKIGPDQRPRLNSFLEVNMPKPAHISRQIWDMKYRLKAADGAALDSTVEDSWRRVAKALAGPEKNPEAWAERFYGALEDFAHR